MGGTTCGVSVQTWGTHHGAGNGMYHYFDTNFFGGNVGHAAITVTIPANKEGEELIKQYCLSDKGKTIIPNKKKIKTLSDGTQEEVYEVRFSWWPPDSSTRKKTSFEDDINEDRMDERLGVDSGWGKNNTIFSPEERLYRGKLGNTIKRLGPTYVAHMRDLTEDQQTLLKMKAEERKFSADESSIDLLIKKFDPTTRKEKVKDKEDKLSSSEVLLLKNLLPESYAKHKEEGVELDEGFLKEVTEKAKKMKEEIANKRQRNGQIRANLKAKSSNLPRQLEIGEEIHQLEVKARKALVLNQMLEDNINGIDDIEAEYTDKAGLEMEFGDSLDLNFDGWEEYVKDPGERITKEEVAKLISVLNERAAPYLKQIDELTVELEQLKSAKEPTLDNVEDYLTLGKLEDGLVSLPIKTFPGTDVGLSNGMDAAEMLKQMNKLATDKTKFNLRGKNCSETVGKILEAGAPERHMKGYAADRAWGAFGNPQMVYNAATKIQSAIMKNEKTGLFYGLRNMSPIRTAGGALIKILTNKSASRTKKFAASIAGIGVGIAALGAATVRSILDPAGAFKTVRGLHSFAYSGSSAGLKAAATLALTPIMAVLAIPAMAQTTVSTIVFSPVKAVGRAIGSLFSGSPPEVNIEEENMTEEIKNTREELEQDLFQSIDSKIMDVDQSDPEKAIKQFIEILQQPDKVPVFTNKSIGKLRKAISKGKDISPKLQSFIDELDVELKEKIGITDETKSIEDIFNKVNTAALQSLNRINTEFKETNVKKIEKAQVEKLLPKKKSIKFSQTSKEDSFTSPTPEPTPGVDKPKM